MTSRPIYIQLDNGRWQMYDVDPWVEPPEGYIAILEDGKELWSRASDKEDQ